MPSSVSPANPSSSHTRSAFNFTEISTFRLLICVGLTCAGIWAVIATTVGS